MDWPIAVWVCLACVAGLLVAERLGRRTGVWAAKPAASTAFVLAAVGWGALESTYGTLVLVGLCLCWLGDVLLIPRERPMAFQLGILSFLLGHVAYAAAFATRQPDLALLGVGGVAALAAGWGALRWLTPHLPADFVVPVRLYVVVILAMVATGLSVVGTPAGPTILVGAVLFALSDLSVARDRFIAPGFVNGAWGLPAYYVAQLVLGYTVAV